MGMADHIQPDAAYLVPLPRAIGRTVAYGVDPASVLAGELHAITGVPVAGVITAPVWWRRRAGSSRAARHGVGFRLKNDPGMHLVLIDDVLTTGQTAASAVGAIGRPDISILTATSAGTM